MLIPLAIYATDMPQMRPQTDPGGFLWFWRPRAQDGRRTLAESREQTLIPEAYENPVELSDGT
jgi:hypothetical protein